MALSDQIGSMPGRVTRSLGGGKSVPLFQFIARDHPSNGRPKIKFSASFPVSAYGYKRLFSDLCPDVCFQVNNGHP